jgi:hypothetical protein
MPVASYPNGDAYRMRKGLFIAGLMALGIGFYILALAIGILPGEGITSPHWILGLTGMAFVVGGGLVCLGELLLHDDAGSLRDFEVARVFRTLMVILLLVIFTILGNWVAFGPGGRPIQAVVGLPFVDQSINAGEWLGRFGFGISALSLDLLLIMLVVSFLRTRQNKQAESK